MPLESYGQSETAQTSKNAQTDPGALLDFLDEFIDIEDLQNGDESFCETLLTSQTDIEKAQDQVNRIPETKKRLIDIQQQLRTLEAANAKEVVALERRIAEERGMRETLSQQVKDLTAMFELSDAEEVLAAMGNLATPEHLRVGVSEYHR
jgi:hypothetical protein